MTKQQFLTKWGKYPQYYGGGDRSLREMEKDLTDLLATERARLVINAELSAIQFPRGEGG